MTTFYEQLGYTDSDEFIATENNFFPVGTVFRLHTDDGTTMPKFVSMDGTSTRYEFLGKLTLATPFHRAGYTQDTHFIEREPYWFDGGEILKLDEDDGSDAPLFVSVTDKEAKAYVPFEDLAVVATPAKEVEVELTPYQAAGYTSETRFVERVPRWFPAGAELKLDADDGSTNPRFCMVEDPDTRFFVTMSRLDVLPVVVDISLPSDALEEQATPTVVDAYTLSVGDEVSYQLKVPEGVEMLKWVAVPSVEMTKYDRTIKSSKNDNTIVVDVYSVLEAFQVNNAAIAHAVKKLLAPGKRGVKSEEQDIREAISALQRALEM